MNVEIITITDRSGSMDKLRDDVIGGYNTFIEEQKGVPGEARLTHVQFDGAHSTLYQAIPLADAPALTRATYVPGGSTALMDAIGHTLEVQGKRINEQGWADKVIVNIITDGEENCSREYKLEQIKTMIEHAQGRNWSFVFMAANQDAFKVGASYGISGATTANFTASGAGMRDAYGSTSAMVTELRSAP